MDDFEGTYTIQRKGDDESPRRETETTNVNLILNSTTSEKT